MSTPKPMHVAMWSGPRNISTAMMRSWGNRRDTYVCDEPLYAHYLKHTGLPHPGASEVIAYHETDWRKVVAWLTGPIPEGKRIFYQKHMTHHLLPQIEIDWLGAMTNCFLIREPREMLTSLLHFIPQPTLADTGLPQQWRIYEWVQHHGDADPPVLDAEDVLRDPRGMLARLCTTLELEFTEQMLAWPPGRRNTDGIWARHWYAAVEKSTGFGPCIQKDELVPASMHELLEQCEAIYQRLYDRRLQP